MAQGLSATDGRLPGSFLLHTPTASSLSFHFGLPLPAVVGGLKSLQHNVDPVINIIAFFTSYVITTGLCQHGLSEGELAAMVMSSCAHPNALTGQCHLTKTDNLLFGF